jgi:hypothetical protein
MISESSRPLYRGAQIVWCVLLLVEGLLAIRFALKLLQANPGALFTDFIYALSSVFTFSFATVFQNMRVESSAFEWTTLLAMLVYWLIAVAIVKLFIMSKSVSAVEADQKLTE